MRLKFFLVFIGTFCIAGPAHSKKIEIANLPKVREPYIVIANQNTLLTHAQEQKIDQNILIKIGLLNLIAHKKLTESEIENNIDSAFTMLWIPIEQHLKSERPRSFEQNKNEHYRRYLAQYNELKPQLIQILRDTAIQEEIEV